MRKSIRDKFTFGDLKRGDHFIDFPTPGDNEGHGGYKCAYRLFEKISPKRARALNPDPSGDSKWITSDFSKELTIIQVTGAEVGTRERLKISSRAIKGLLKKNGQPKRKSS